MAEDPGQTRDNRVNDFDFPFWKKELGINSQKLKSPYEEKYKETLKGNSLVERLEMFQEWMKDKDTEIYVAGMDRYTYLQTLLRDALEQIHRQ